MPAATIVLKDYVRFQLGEGIEKAEADFAAEVAAAAGVKPRANRLNRVPGRRSRITVNRRGAASTAGAPFGR